MAIPLNIKLYQKVKLEADKIYKKPSAYKSGYIIKKYKELGGKFKDDGERKLTRWFNEKWGDIGNFEKWGDIGNLNYPVYRPFVRINENTPLTINEINPIQAKEQIKLKQIIKGNKNLPPFKGKGIKQYIKVENIPKNDKLYIYSNPKEAQKKAFNYLGNEAYLYKSDKPDKKYMIYDPNNNKWVYFGQMNFFDYTSHKNYERMLRYRARAENIRGNWKNDKYSPNNLSINILW